jgi:hypothetical protein
LTEAQGIDDAGQVVGWYDGGGALHGFLATPMPEPGSLAGLMTGLTILLVLARRRRDPA